MKTPTCNFTPIRLYSMPFQIHQKYLFWTLLSACDLLPPANQVWDKKMFSQACVIPSVQGGGYVCMRGGCFRGRVCLQGGLHPGDSASRWVCLQGGLHLSGGLHPGGRMGRTSPRQLWCMVNKRAVRILLECILVCYANGKLSAERPFLFHMFWRIFVILLGPY